MNKTSQFHVGPCFESRNTVKTASYTAIRKNEVSKNDWTSQDLNRDPPGRRACALPLDHGDP